MSTKTEAGHYIQVVAAYLASLEMIIAASSHHSSIISTQVGRWNKDRNWRVGKEMLG